MQSAFHIPGRHRLAPDGLFSWTWPGVYAECILDGADFELQAKGPCCELRISLDECILFEGTLGPELFTWSWKGDIGTHSLRIQTTHQESDRLFTLVKLTSTGTISAAKPRAKHIEFVGDSWTCGFGNLSSDELRSDCTRAYAALCANRLHSDYALVSISGRGIAKNYGEQPPSDHAIPDFYAQATKELGRRADIGVILAGENDFSFEPHPSKELFQSRYRHLLSFMRTTHPGIQIYTVGVHRNHPGLSMIRAVYEAELASGASDLQFIALPDLDGTQQLGYLWHPGLEHHRQLAALISATIQL